MKKHFSGFKYSAATVFGAIVKTGRRERLYVESVPFLAVEAALSFILLLCVLKPFDKIRGNALGKS